MIGYIYKIQKNDNMYIGSTTQTLTSRQYKHNFKLKDNIYQYRLYKFCRNNNITNIILQEIEEVEVETKKDLFKIEQKYMNFFKPNLNERKSYRTKEERLIYDRERHSKKKECPICKRIMRSDSLIKHLKKKTCIKSIMNE